MPANQSAPDKRKRRKGKATLLSKTHIGPTAQAGHEERLAAYVKRTLQLKREGYPYYAIAEMIAVEFQLEVVPHIATVAKWRKHGMGAIDEDIQELQNQLRIDQWNELDRMKAKWLPIALAAELEIQRWKMEEGSLQPFMDSDAIKEQMEASKIIVSIMGRQSKLLGLDLAQAVPDKGEGPQSLQSLQTWLIGEINRGNGSDGARDTCTEVLELRCGIPEIDEAEGRTFD